MRELRATGGNLEPVVFETGGLNLAASRFGVPQRSFGTHETRTGLVELPLDDDSSFVEALDRIGEVRISG